MGVMMGVMMGAELLLPAEPVDVAHVWTWCSPAPHASGLLLHVCHCDGKQLFSGRLLWPVL